MFCLLNGNRFDIVVLLSEVGLLILWVVTEDGDVQWVCEKSA